MDWVSKGSQPGFHELIVQHLGASKAGKALKTLAFAEIFFASETQKHCPFGGCRNFQAESCRGSAQY